jgi:hypothetical protein
MPVMTCMRQNVASHVEQMYMITVELRSVSLMKVRVDRVRASGVMTRWWQQRTQSAAYATLELPLDYLYKQESIDQWYALTPATNDDADTTSPSAASTTSSASSASGATQSGGSGMTTSNNGDPSSRTSRNLAGSGDRSDGLSVSDELKHDDDSSQSTDAPQVHVRCQVKQLQVFNVDTSQFASRRRIILAQPVVPHGAPPEAMRDAGTAASTRPVVTSLAAGAGYASSPTTPRDTPRTSGTMARPPSALGSLLSTAMMPKIASPVSPYVCACCTRACEIARCAQCEWRAVATVGLGSPHATESARQVTVSVGCVCDVCSCHTC